jgi:hypothetical protein
MVWFRECWHEEVLRQLRQVLTKCHQVAFETRTDGMSRSKFFSSTSTTVHYVFILLFIDFIYYTLIFATAAAILVGLTPPFDRSKRVRMY